MTPRKNKFWEWFTRDQFPAWSIVLGCFFTAWLSDVRCPGPSRERTIPALTPQDKAEIMRQQVQYLYSREKSKEKREAEEKKMWEKMKTQMEESFK